MRFSMSLSASGSAAAKSSASAIRMASAKPSSRDGRWLGSIWAKSCASSAKTNPPHPPRNSHSTSNHMRKNLGPRFALDPKRREGRVLTDQDHTLPRHFKRRGKRRSPDRAAHFGRRAKSHEISVEHRPIERPPGKFFKFAARTRERPDQPLLHGHPRERLFLTTLGIGGQQLVKACAPSRRGAG